MLRRSYIFVYHRLFSDKALFESIYDFFGKPLQFMQKNQDLLTFTRTTPIPQKNWIEKSCI